jgi:hypothetical protein
VLYEVKISGDQTHWFFPPLFSATAGQNTVGKANIGIEYYDIL